MNDMLVSVVVVTYNSAEFIIEALDSVKAQTYQHIELIISDDGSKDDTVGLCKQWLQKNTSRFENCELLVSTTNTGNTANYNRGWRRAKGEWIKNLDGDDRLLPNCISDYVDFVKIHPKTDMVFAKMNSFSCNQFNEADEIWNKGGVYFKKFSIKEFELVVYIYNSINSPTTFIKRDSYLKLGGYDERYKYIEDWPMWMRMVNEGFVLQYMDIITVDYRISNYSISQDVTTNVLKAQYEECKLMVQKKAIWYLRNHSLSAKLYFFTKDRKDRGNSFWRIVHYINVINPFFYRYMKVLKG